jgi:hypothetical protein
VDACLLVGFATTGGGELKLTDIGRQFDGPTFGP